MKLLRSLQIFLFFFLVCSDCFAQSAPAGVVGNSSQQTASNRTEILQQVSRVRSSARDAFSRTQAEKDAALLLTRLAMSSVEAGHSGLALQDLADLHPNHWGEDAVLSALRKAAERLLKEIDPAEEREINAALQQSLVTRLLASVESRAPEMRGVVGVFYVRAMLAEIAAGTNLGRVATLHKAFRDRRPQDETFRDVMLKRAQKPSTKDLVLKLEKLNATNWGALIYWAVVALLLGIVFVLLRVLKQKLQKKSSRKGYQNLVYQPDEYARLLASFGLEEGASESQIRAAYRTQVKSYHPDSRRSAGKEPLSEAEADEKFLELKKAHDRLLEMRSSFFR